MRLIDADALKKKGFSDPDTTMSGEALVYVKDIDEAPTIDAEPVKHGRWEKVIPSKSAAKWSNKMSCSICHKQGYTYHNYCPNCGAKMEVG